MTQDPVTGLPDNNARLDREIDHAWKYFEIHASQRMTLFNYFSAFSGLIVAGIGASLQASPKFAFVAAGLGVVLAAVSFIFWKLDQRVSFLVKHAEDVHAELEALGLENAKLFTSEPRKFSSARSSGNWLTRPWTYGRSFRLLFALMACTGLFAAALSLLRLTGAAS